MKIKPSPLLCGLALMLPALPATADVTVQFVEPQRYADAGGYGIEAQRNLASIERHLLSLGKRCLPAGQRLDIRIFDIDLAGRHEWWRAGAYDLRVMRSITWPRMDIQYVWTDEQGQPLADQRERVSDIDYLTRSAFLRFDSDPLVYDKAMLDEWFERRFCPNPAGIRNAKNQTTLDGRP